MLYFREVSQFFLFTNSDSCEAAGLVDRISAGFVAGRHISPSHGSEPTSAVSAAPQSEINTFIFYSGNNFDEICSTQWCSNQSANQGQ